MSHQGKRTKPARTSRREFLKCATTAAGALAAGLPIGRGVHASGSDLLKIGLVGCGGRGTG
ncbi:MAG: twin-arginine translocation signal domain-containing protein, partial [Pirellulales bacterium]|nr:twin-arginine translocation signal domain-containing protein [Pirellulales bacterium]